MMPFIDLKAQYERIKPEVDAAIQRVLEHGRYIMGPEIDELEEKLSDFAGSRHCLACASGTDALLIPLMAYGVGPGDAVFTTPFTFFATTEVIAMLGATPVFVDIDPDTYNLDPGRLASTIEAVLADGTLTPRGIIPVDLFGLCADYEAILPIAEKYGLFVLEDAAQGFGAELKGKRAPSFGQTGATSFFPAKPLGAYGDGGAVFTDDDDMIAEMRSIRVHGQGEDKYNNVRIGINGRLDSIQAAILLQKLSIYQDEINARQRVAGWYGEKLAGLVKTPVIPEGYVSVWAQYCVQSDRRAEIQAALKAAEVPTAIYYVRPMHLLGAMAPLGYSEGDFPISEAVCSRIFALPFHPYMGEDAVSRIAEVIASVAG